MRPHSKSGGSEGVFSDCRLRVDDIVGVAYRTCDNYSDLNLHFPDLTESKPGLRNQEWFRCTRRWVRLMNSDITRTFGSNIDSNETSDECLKVAYATETP